MSRGAEVRDGVALAADVVGVDVGHVVFLDGAGEVRVDLDALCEWLESESEGGARGRTLSRSCSSIAIRRDWNHSNESSASTRFSVSRSTKVQRSRTAQSRQIQKKLRATSSALAPR